MENTEPPYRNCYCKKEDSKEVPAEPPYKNMYCEDEPPKKQKAKKR